MAGDDVEINIRASNGQAVRAFRDTQGRLRDMRGQFVSESALMSAAMGRVTSSIGSVSGGMMSLKSVATGTGAALGVALLPAIGALTPAALGLGAAAGTLALGFNGVGEAVSLAGSDSKKYAETLKKMSPEQRDFVKSLVEAKKEFSGVGKEIQKAMLPGFTRAVKAADPVVKILGDSMTDLGGSFGDMADKAGRALKDSGLQDDLRANLKMGSDFALDMAGSMGDLGRSMLDFGAKSQPTLDGLQNLAGGLMDTGLPGMFRGLEAGVQGTADILDGLAFALNDKLLPALGEFSGQFAAATGPLFKQAFMALGDVGGTALTTLADGMRLAAPLFHDLSEGLRGVRTIAGEIAPVMADVGSAIANALIPGDLGEGPLARLADMIDRNRGSIQEAARLVGDSILTLVQAGAESLPYLVTAFRVATGGILTALDGIVSGAAAAFGWLPGVGDALEAANTKFDSFAAGFRDSLATAQEQANNFAASTSEKLSAGRLKLDINSWTSQIATAREQLKTVPPEKRSELRALIGDLEAKVARARGLLNGLDGKVATTYVNSIVTTTKKSVHEVVGATGGLFTGSSFRHGYADGGPVVGPGTGTSDDVFAPWLSNGEFVMKAAAVDKYGEKFMQSVNDGQLDMPRMAKGGLTDAERSARAGLSSQFGINRFGRMAGWGTTSFEKGLGAPQDMSALVSALSDVRASIKAATSGRTESTLLRTLDSVGKRLIGQEKALAKVNGALDKAKDKLDSLKSAASQLSDSVRGGVLSSANITRGRGDGPVTVASIMSGLTASRDKATAFAGALKDLKGKGLDKGLLQQIAEAGIEGGGLETAGALLGASSSEIKSLNSLQGQIGSAAGAAGKTTADAMYGAAIKAQTASVNRLQQSQDKLEKSMATLARVMEKAISRAIGKKAGGGIVGGSGLTMVGEQGIELLDLPVGSRVLSNPDSRRLMGEAAAPWTSMLNAPRRSSGGRGAAGGQQEVKVVLEIRGTGNSRYQDFLVDELQRAVRARGSIEATLRPPRGR